jgi:HlyD family secretion protein
VRQPYRSRSFLVAVGVVVLLVPAYAAAGDKKEPAHAYRTAPVTRGRLTVTVGATGTLQPREVVDVGAQVMGRIVALGKDKDTKSGVVDWGSEVEGPVLGKDGKVVRPGTVLAQMDDELYRGQLKSAEAALKSARADLQLKKAQLGQADGDWERAQKLFATNALAQAEFDHFRAGHKVAQAKLAVSEANVGVAEANLRTAQTNLDYTVIRSPVKGVVIDRRVNVGQTVVASLSAPSLFLIAKDLSQMEVWATVNEADVGKITAGQAVTFTVDAFPDRTFKGRVVPQGKFAIRLNATQNQGVVTYTAVIDVDNADLKLVPYLTAEVRFTVANKKDALLAPGAALRWRPAPEQVAPDLREAYARLRDSKRPPEHGLVWTEGKDGFVRYAEIRTGASDGASTEILSGDLKEGTRLIVGERRPAGQKSDGGFGPNNVLVLPATASAGGLPFGNGAVNTLTAKDADAIARECPAVASAAPVVRTRTPATFAHKDWVPSFIYGTIPAYLDVRGWQMEEGELFTDADVRDRARVCVIGQTIKRELFDNESPVGQEILLKNVRFKVVGVLGALGETKLGWDQDDVILAPWTTIKARVVGSTPAEDKRPAAAVNAATTVKSLSQSYPGSKDAVYPSPDPLRVVDYPPQKSGTAIDQILVCARSAADVPRAVRQITDLLRRRHQIRPAHPNDFSVRDLNEMARALDAVKKR